MEQFDFNDVGKRVPYRVPDGFFNSMEGKIMQQVADIPMEEAPAHGKSRVKILWRTLISTAAVAAIVIGLWVVFHPKDSAAADFAAVEKAFDQLSPEDQEFLLQVYEDDVFMDE